MVMPKKKRNNCRFCDEETLRPGYIYCSNKCQQSWQYDEYIKRWQRGEEHGLQKMGVVSRHVKRYLREKFDNKCCLCSWAKVNPKTGIVPLVADHVDGNWQNNTESNLRLICPNCDSLQPTYAALNKGNGRKGRHVSNRVHIAKKLVAKNK